MTKYIDNWPYQPEKKKEYPNETIELTEDEFEEILKESEIEGSRIFTRSEVKKLCEIAYNKGHREGFNDGY